MSVIPPIQAISIFVGDSLCAHEELVNAAYKKIKAELPKICSPTGEYVGVEHPIFVRLPGITQAALLEVVLNYRKQGWKVSYGIDFNSPGREPMITLTVPRE